MNLRLCSYEMLSTAEKNLAEELLSYLTEYELFALAKTITRGEITLRTVDDAQNAILEYSENAQELLSRKKVKREVLVQYLADVGRSFSLSLDKAGICDVVLAHWGADSTTRRRSPVMRSAIKYNSPKPPSASNESISKHEAPPPSGPTPSTSSTPSAPIDYTELAREFALWFYPMVNSCSEPGSTHSFGPQHFYEHCSLYIKCVSPQPSTESHEGAERVACRMLQFIQEEGLTFCPNTQPDGLQGKCDSFGIVIISVCGTVHKGNQCIGIFKQQFTMAKDVTIDSWKVKQSRLMLAAEEVSGPLSLADVDQRLS